MKTKIAAMMFFALMVLSSCVKADQSSTAEPTEEKPLNFTSITIDGYDDDWGDRELNRVAEAADAEAGFLDIAGGYAFVTNDALYIYLDLLNPDLAYTQIDFELRPDGMPLLVSWKPGDGEPGGLAQSSVAVADGIEARFDLAAMGSPEDVQIKEIRIMAGDCCEYPKWRAVDVWAPDEIPFVNEVDAVSVAMGTDSDASTTDNEETDPSDDADKEPESDTPEIGLQPGEDFLVDEPLMERPRYVWLEQSNEYADYLFRDFSQNAQEAEWGPDGYLYIADGSGKHIIKVAPDGSMEDLGIWKTHRYMQEYGPNALEFDLDGNLIFNTGPYVYRYNVDGSIDFLFNTPEGDVRALAKNEDGVLYYSLNTGYIYRWNPDGEDELIAFYSDPQFCVGPDHKLYISVYHGDNIVVVDPETKEANTLFGNKWPLEGLYCDFDAAGDLWLRGGTVFNQFTLDGEDIPFTVDGEPSEFFRRHLSGDIAFDDQGNLWVTYASGEILRLSPVVGEENAYSTTFTHDSFEAANVAVGPDGTVYATNLYPGDLWAFAPDGSYEIFWEHGDQGRVGIDVDKNGIVYVGSVKGEVFKIENGGISHYADVDHAHRLIAADDNNLYLVTNGYGATEPSKILRITGQGQVEVFLTELGGVVFDDRPPQIAPKENGLYILNQQNGTFYEVDYEGNAKELLQIANNCEFSLIASSPTTGKIYFIADDEYSDWSNIDRYVLYEYTPGGELVIISPVVPGDPAGMDVSFDGKWLYIVEVGAVDKIPLEP